jgi:hypothetical protein
MPPGETDKDAFIDQVCGTIPEIAHDKLADAVDAFCEGIAFSAEQTARVFKAAQAAGLKVKLHADQLSNLHGAKLAADFGALSADHLEYTDEEGAAAMARAAPPAPSSTAGPEAGCQPAAWSRTFSMKPKPSVFDPSISPSRNTSVFTAPARRAVASTTSQTAKAASLCGMVTLAPWKPRLASARTAVAKPSGCTGKGR